MDSERLLRAAKVYRDRATRAYKSISGSDVAEAPAYDFAADMLGEIAEGDDPEEVFDHYRKMWKVYAQEQRDRVEAAPKIVRGPMSGHSIIHHRWVSDYFIESHIETIRSLMNRT